MSTPILSASQISNFGTVEDGGTTEGCHRRWAFKYLAKLPEKENASAAAGKQIHVYLEQWLGGSVFPEGGSQAALTARAMIKYLPEPSPDLRVEQPFTYELEGVPIRGFIDLMYYDNSVLVIADHKTTSDLRWSKSQDDLRHDPQAILYAYQGFREADTVELRWLYGTRAKSPQVLPVSLSIDFDEVVTAIKPLTQTGKRIISLYQSAPDPNTLAPNLSQCDAFGGCSFKAACSITPLDRVKALQHQHKRSEDKKMGFRDRLKNNNNGTGAATPVEVTAVEQTVEVAPTAVAKPTMREKLQGFGSAINPPVSAPVDTPVPTPMPEPVKRKPGRPRKSEGAPFTPKAEWVAAAVEPDATGFTLYVNCMPQGPSTTLAKYLEPILAAINLEHGVEHYAMIDFKAAGILGAALYTALQANPPTGALVMDARTGEGAHSLPTLERFASTVVRGF